MSFNGIGNHLGGIMKVSNAKSRSISAENVYGQKASGGMAELSDEPQSDVAKIGQQWDGPSKCARDLELGWKVRPCITLPPRSVTTLMDVDGPGCIQHIWITVDGSANWLRDLIVRMYWDGEAEASVEAPLGDFFCNAAGYQANIMAVPINVNPRNGMNCYFPMPFRKHAKITIENRNPDKEREGFFYTINYALTDIADDDAYFHAQFRRSNPLAYKTDHLMLDGIKGKGQFVGCYMAWQQNNAGWWGEGEIKMFLDGDAEFPTICGTGTEDYFGGAWCFAKETYSAPFLGYPVGGDFSAAGKRHGLYRFHILDPVRFEEDLKVTMQAIGWRDGGRYLPLQDDISSTSYWYQLEPHNKFPELPSRDYLEVI